MVTWLTNIIEFLLSDIDYNRGIYVCILGYILYLMKRGKRKFSNMYNSTDQSETKKKKLQRPLNKSKDSVKDDSQSNASKAYLNLDKNKNNINETKHKQRYKENDIVKKKTETINKQHDTNNSKATTLSHKGCTGSTNWEKYLTEQGKKFIIDKNPIKGNAIQSSKSYNNKETANFTKVIGIDCEMVGVGEDGKNNILARVSIVNLFGDCLYDKFVKPTEEVTDYRTFVSGVRAADLKNADDFEIVQKEVAGIIKGRILVGHALKHDLEVLFLRHPRHLIRDTSKFFRKKGSGTPSLKNLASEFLNVKIQSGEHSSIQDAQAAVQLYNMYKKQWEAGGGNKASNRIDTSCSNF